MECLEWINDELKQVHDSNLFRYLTELQTGQSPEVTIGGKNYILLASNSYLGLSVDPRVVKAAEEALRKYGTGSGGSRLVSGSSDLHRQLEEKIARFKNTESAILFSSGYLANSDELNHASIIDGCRLSKANLRIYNHLDFEQLDSLVSGDSNPGKKLVVTDTVFSMDGDLADLKVLAGICEKHNAMLMVDEAHATGVLGERGSGATEYFGVEERVPIVMGTLSKAVGSLGGYIAGSRELIDFIRNRVRSYIFDTSLPAASLAASLKSIEIIENENESRKHLWKMIEIFKSGLSELGYNVIPSNSAIVPILTGDPGPTLRIAEKLREEGVFTPAVRPPSVAPGKCRIRSSLMSSHTEQHIKKALSAFEKAGQRA